VRGYVRISDLGARTSDLGVLAVALWVACGGPPEPAPPGQPYGNVIRVAWRAKQADGPYVDVALVVAGRAFPLGQLDATADDELASPATCAIRTADPRRTAFSCGRGREDYNYFIAELTPEGLVIARVWGQHGDRAAERRVEVERVAIDAVAMLVEAYNTYIPPESSPTDSHPPADAGPPES
jgi:hypothetical protein